MAVNLLGTLPIPVICLASSEAERKRRLTQLEAYFNRNKLVYRTALKREHTLEAMRLAAHSAGLRLVTWRNQTTGKSALVVGCKREFKNEQHMTEVLSRANVVASLKTWTQ